MTTLRIGRGVPVPPEPTPEPHRSGLDLLILGLLLASLAGLVAWLLIGSASGRVVHGAGDLADWGLAVVAVCGLGAALVGQPAPRRKTSRRGVR